MHIVRSRIAKARRETVTHKSSFIHSVNGSVNLNATHSTRAFLVLTAVLAAAVAEENDVELELVCEEEEEVDELDDDTLDVEEEETDDEVEVEVVDAGTTSTVSMSSGSRPIRDRSP